MARPNRIIDFDKTTKSRAWGNFYGRDGRPYIRKCCKCKQENYAPAVATGTCAWCGWKAPAKKEDPSVT